MKKMCAAALMALAMISPGSGTSFAARDMEAITGSVPPAAGREVRFRLHSSVDAGICAVTAAAVPDAQDRRTLNVGPGCADIVGRIGAARWWQDREDGSVAFVGENGKVLAEFAVADGAAFVSYAPRQPIMTLLAAD
jgi:hypothetical protein